MIDVKNLLNIASKEKYEKGEVIVRETDKIFDEMFIILSGSVSVFKHYQHEDEVLLSTIKTGGFFGEMSLFLSKPRTATIIAAEETFLLSITKDTFSEILSKDSDVIYQIMFTLCERLAKANEEKLNHLAVLQEYLGTDENERREIIRKSMEETVTPVSKTKASDNEQAEGEKEQKNILPKEHKLYNLPHNELHDNLIIYTNHKCPLCKNEFDSPKTLKSQLKQIGTLKCDLVRRFKDFSVPMYEVITCPNCLFSYFEEYSDTYVNPTSEFKAILASFKEKYNYDYIKNRNYDVSIATCYLAIACSYFYQDQYQIRLRCYRMLDMLFDELSDEEMKKITEEKVYLAALDYYNNDTISEEGTQAVFMIIGSYANKIGKLDEAYKFLGNAKFIKTGKRAYRTLIERELEDVREQMQILAE